MSSRFRIANECSFTPGAITQPLIAQIFCGTRIKSELLRMDLKKNKPKINPETKRINILIFSGMVYFEQAVFQKQTAGFGCIGRALNARQQVKGAGHE